ncbi:MAG: bifunctional pyr operon transcriptional regulator/uracil phosphoribosyltransferase PyrR [Bacteroidia bacterium]
MHMSNRTLILNSHQIEQRLNRLAWQVYENCYDEKEIIIAGIAKNGTRIAEKIAALLREISPIQISLIDLTFNKDNPLNEPPFISLSAEEMKGKTVIIIDDVSNSGRTLIYAVKAFLDFPVNSVQTLVLVDRDHNRFPVKTNYVGLSLATTLQEHISVEYNGNASDAVYLD